LYSYFSNLIFTEQSTSVTDRILLQLNWVFLDIAMHGNFVSSSSIEDENQNESPVK
jgi:hypothetical protein